MKLYDSPCYICEKRNNCTVSCNKKIAWEEKMAKVNAEKEKNALYNYMKKENINYTVKSGRNRRMKNKIRGIDER